MIIEYEKLIRGIYEKIKDYDFRDLDRRFVIVKNTKDLLKSLKAYDIREPFYGFIYIDHECGLTLSVLGNDSTKDKYVGEIRLIARYDTIKNYSVKVIDDSKFKYWNEILELHEIYYTKYRIQKTRDFEYLDEFRCEGYPDDIKVMAVVNDNNLEQLWVRIFDYVEKDNALIGELLNTSYFDDSLKEGTLVSIAYLAEQNVLFINNVLEVIRK